MIIPILKRILCSTLYRSGSNATILWGPLRGYKYRVNDNSGWSSVYGGWERTAQAAFLKLIRPGQVVYDLGANTGMHTLLFSKLVGSAGVVFAFEPLPDNIDEIESLMRLNGVSNVTVVPAAVSNRSGRVNFVLGTTNQQGRLESRGQPRERGIEVNVKTLDALIDEGLKKPDFIKVDIEGAEGDALDGFAKTLALSWPTFMVELHDPEQDIRVGVFFQQFGYKLFRLKNEITNRHTSQKDLLVEIANPAVGWPDLNGMWGTVIALPPAPGQRRTPAGAGQPRGVGA